jgi:hypothetical protein
MKSEEFKKILKPLIERTVREVLLQEGILSQVVSEVAKGLSNPVVETRRSSASALTDDSKEQRELYERQKAERIKKLNESVGYSGDIFKGTKETPASDSKSALSGVSPTDSGVDISGIQKLAKGRWKALAGDK